MLSEKIKKLRTEKGLSQEELAIELHVVRQTVSKWEKGLSLPDSNTLIGLAKALDTTVSVLLDETDESKPSPSVSKSSKIMVTILLILGSPIWLSLLVAAVAVLISAYAVIWSLWVALAAVEISFAACAVAGVVLSLVYIPLGKVAAGLFMLGAGVMLLGLSIFLWFACKAVLVGLVKLSKMIFVGFWIPR